MNHESDFKENAAAKDTPETETPKNAVDMLLYLKLCSPVLLFPVLYYPYTLWWRRGFAGLAVQVAGGLDSQLVQLMLTGNNTILLFWCAVTVFVMLAAIVLSALRVRPWFIIPIYLAVVFSLCGIFSLTFYTLILR